MGDQLFSGWGVRTMAEGEGGYNPIGYHVGTVWPHDNSHHRAGPPALRIPPARPRGSRRASSRLRPYFDVPAAGGVRRLRARAHAIPGRVPDGLQPAGVGDGRAAAAPPAVLGLEPGIARLDSSPVLPENIQSLEITNIPGRWGRDSVGASAADTLMAALGSAAAEAPGSISELFERLDERVGPVAGRMGHVSLRFDLGEGEHWRIAFDDGHLDVGRSDADADCIIETTEDTLRDLLAGRERAQTAALSGKVKVRGDMAIAARVGSLF